MSRPATLLDDARVKLGAGASTQFGDRQLGAYRPAIRALGGHGVKRVADGDDA